MDTYEEENIWEKGAKARRPEGQNEDEEVSHEDWIVKPTG
jgi:hypothetical protein